MQGPMRRFAPDTLRRIGCALFEAVGRVTVLETQRLRAYIF